MKEHKVGCLPVVDDEDRLIGIITERDFLGMSAQLLEEGLAKAD
jgi:CBS-domain-containing membrane protein